MLFSEGEAKFPKNGRSLAVWSARQHVTLIGEATPEPARLHAGAALWRPKCHPCITPFGSRLTAGFTGSPLTLSDTDRSIFMAASGQILNGRQHNSCGARRCRPGAPVARAWGTQWPHTSAHGPLSGPRARAAPYGAAPQRLALLGYGAAPQRLALLAWVGAVLGVPLPLPDLTHSSSARGQEAPAPQDSTHPGKEQKQDQGQDRGEP